MQHVTSTLHAEMLARIAQLGEEMAEKMDSRGSEYDSVMEQNEGLRVEIDMLREKVSVDYQCVGNHLELTIS